jgi:hypothetical protein
MHLDLSIHKNREIRPFERSSYHLKRPRLNPVPGTTEGIYTIHENVDQSMLCTSVFVYPLEYTIFWCGRIGGLFEYHGPQ